MKTRVKIIGILACIISIFLIFGGAYVPGLGDVVATVLVVAGFVLLLGGLAFIQILGSRDEA
ncbi:hypothetical protein [Curtanaerobium respiraculi]|uniref:hypothetical protein n=1 Tax=Curtanaerobium respiraculi TaxID=2949669 RepID=UPI0024B363C9|nr:hypothetical protein [Curtanaerobium respiraculi]